MEVAVRVYPNPSYKEMTIGLWQFDVFYDVSGACFLKIIPREKGERIVYPSYITITYIVDEIFKDEAVKQLYINDEIIISRESFISLSSVKKRELLKEAKRLKENISKMEARFCRFRSVEIII